MKPDCLDRVEPDEGVVITSMQGTVIHACPKVATMMGTTQEEMRGRSMREYTLAEDRSGHMATVGSSVPAKDRVFTAVRADGRQITVSSRSCPGEVGGHPVRLSFVKQVAKRKQARRKTARGGRRAVDSVKQTGTEP